MIQGAIILILAMAAVIGTACIFNATVRTAIARFIGGTFWNIAAFMPTWQQIGGALAAAGIILLIVLAVSLAAYVLFGLLFFTASTAFGYKIGWGKTGIAFGIMFPLWFFLFTLPRVLNKLPIAGKMMRFTRWIITPTTAVLTLMLVYGTIFPNLSQSTARNWEDSEQGWANTVDKKSAQSEKEAGIQGFAAENNVAVYTNENGTEIKKLLQKGDAFRVFNLKGKPADEDSIGRLPIVLPNDFGDAIGKDRRGWIASKNIIWKYEKEPAGVKSVDYNQTPAQAPTPIAMPATYTQPAQVVTAAPEPPAPKINISGDWNFDWEDPGQTGFRISQIGTNLSGKSHYRPGEMILTGSINGTSGEGTWELIGHPSGHLQGRFYITSLTDSAGEGKWIHNDGHTTRLTMRKI
jgi:hypothetical protein